MQSSHVVPVQAAKEGELAYNIVVGAVKVTDGATALIALFTMSVTGVSGLPPQEIRAKKQLGNNSNLLNITPAYTTSKLLGRLGKGFFMFLGNI